MNIFLSAWAAIAFTIYWIDFARIPAKINALNRKPFNCEACLPIWAFAVFLVLAIYVCQYIPATIGAACTAGIITPIIIKKISK